MPCQDHVLRGEVERVVYLGPRSAAHIRLEGGTALMVHLPNAPGANGAWHPSGKVDLLPLPGAIMLLPN